MGGGSVGGGGSEGETKGHHVYAAMRQWPSSLSQFVGAANDSHSAQSAAAMGDGHTQQPLVAGATGGGGGTGGRGGGEGVGKGHQA